MCCRLQFSVIAEIKADSSSLGTICESQLALCQFHSLVCEPNENHAFKTWTLWFWEIKKFETISDIYLLISAFRSLSPLTLITLIQTNDRFFFWIFLNSGNDKSFFRGKPLFAQVSKISSFLRLAQGLIQIVRCCLRNEQSQTIFFVILHCNLMGKKGVQSLQMAYFVMWIFRLWDAFMLNRVVTS